MNIRAVAFGYEREPFKLTALVEGERVVIAWTRSPLDPVAMRDLEAKGYADVRYSQVKNRKTGDVPR